MSFAGWHRRTAWLAVATAVCTGPAVRTAAQDDAEDRGSRAARSEDERLRWGTRYHVAALGGYHVQGERLGPMVEAGVDETLKVGEHRLRGSADYLYDPFSTKTFNFADEDQVLGDETRLVQAQHEVDGEVGWRMRSTPWLRHEIRLHADVWFPELSRDRRWSVQARPEIRAGADEGVYGELRGELLLKKYPNYLVADRRIDQRALEGTAEVGYAFDDLVEAGVGYELRLTDYLDARYDVLLPDGTVVRADESKDYVRQTPYLGVTVTPGRVLRVKLRYRLELHDSRHYDREMTGVDRSGNTIEKFIPDYYDYVRHGVDLRVRVKPIRVLRIELVAETWIRDFDTYEARDPNNVWTGDLRHDTSVELGAEVAYRFLRFGPKRFRHELWALASASHLTRGSNMEREISIATNYDVTRIFVGVELER